MSTVTATGAAVRRPARDWSDPVYQAFTILRVGFAVAPILFGLDKPGAPDGTLGQCNLRPSGNGAIPLPLYVAQEVHQEAAFPSGAKLLSHDRAAAVAPTLVRPTRRDDDERPVATDAPPPRIRT